MVLCREQENIFEKKFSLSRTLTLTKNFYPQKRICRKADALLTR